MVVSCFYGGFLFLTFALMSRDQVMRQEMSRWSQGHERRKERERADRGEVRLYSWDIRLLLVLSERPVHVIKVHIACI